MMSLLLLHLSFGVLALLVMAVVALLQRHRTVSRDPGRVTARAPRVTAAVAAVADKVDPGEAPPLGVLTTPEKSRRVSRRFEAAEWKVRRGARAITTLARSNG